MAPASKRLREEPVYAPAQRKGCHDGFVYIMYEREFLARGDELYKVGMSELGEETRRMQHGYTGGSQLIACAAVSDARVVESRIKEAFVEQFARFRNLGTERFSGDLLAMKRLFDVLVEPDLLGPWGFIPQAPPSMKAPGPPVSRETVSEDAVSDAVDSLALVPTEDIQQACPVPILRNRICEALGRDVPEPRLEKMLRGLGFWNRKEVVPRTGKSTSVYVRNFPQGRSYVQLLPDIRPSSRSNGCPLARYIETFAFVEKPTRRSRLPVGS
jgi:hypothetical protein